jgi:hypothetical protein
MEKEGAFRLFGWVSAVFRPHPIRAPTPSWCVGERGRQNAEAAKNRPILLRWRKAAERSDNKRGGGGGGRRRRACRSCPCDRWQSYRRRRRRRRRRRTQLTKWRSLTCRYCYKNGGNSGAEGQGVTQGLRSRDRRGDGEMLARRWSVRVRPYVCTYVPGSISIFHSKIARGCTPDSPSKIRPEEGATAAVRRGLLVRGRVQEARKGPARERCPRRQPQTASSPAAAAAAAAAAAVIRRRIEAP